MGKERQDQTTVPTGKCHGMKLDDEYSRFGSVSDGCGHTCLHPSYMRCSSLCRGMFMKEGQDQTKITVCLNKQPSRLTIWMFMKEEG
jgi:hypothetical protein